MTLLVAPQVFAVVAQVAFVFVDVRLILMWVFAVMAQFLLVFVHVAHVVIAVAAIGIQVPPVPRGVLAVFADIGSLFRCVRFIAFFHVLPEFALILRKVFVVLPQIGLVLADVSIVLANVAAVAADITFVLVDVALILVAVLAILAQIAPILPGVFLVLLDVLRLQGRVLALRGRSGGHQTGEGEPQQASSNKLFEVHKSTLLKNVFP